MKYYKIDYITTDGDHEYTESGVYKARTYESANNKAKMGKRLFNRCGWEEFCKLSSIHEISLQDYNILKNYIINFSSYNI